jgi:hypothetical protein
MLYTYVIDLSMAYADYVAFRCGPLRRMGFEDDYLRVFKKIFKVCPMGPNGVSLWQTRGRKSHDTVL